MYSFDKIKQIASDTLKTEALSISSLIAKLNDDFCRTVQTIYESKGRVVVSGVGKSAIIAQKIVATLNSTGTPSIFMHAADAIHGDLGIIQQDDVVILISKSGDTAEIKVLLPLLKRSNNKLIALTGNPASDLAKGCDYILDSSVDKEACPNNLAPTSSAIAQMAIGDALAVCLVNMRGFTKSDFAKFHPGGNLGKRLYLKVSDISSSNPKPRVEPNTPVKSVLYEITKSRLGAAAVIDDERLVGVITDGDIRRMLEKHDNIGNLTAKDILNPSPKTIEEDQLAIYAAELMQQKNISQLIVMKDNKFAGFVHFHDLMKEGLI